MFGDEHLREDLGLQPGYLRKAQKSDKKAECGLSLVGPAENSSKKEVQEKEEATRSPEMPQKLRLDVFYTWTMRF